MHDRMNSYDRCACSYNNEQTGRGRTLNVQLMDLFVCLVHGAATSEVEAKAGVERRLLADDPAAHGGHLGDGAAPLHRDLVRHILQQHQHKKKKKKKKRRKKKKKET